jgi:hypothetical protein
MTVSSCRLYCAGTGCWAPTIKGKAWQAFQQGHALSGLCHLGQEGGEEGYP